MPINASIPLQTQPIQTIDPWAAQERALQMRDLMDQRKIRQAQMAAAAQEMTTKEHAAKVSRLGQIAASISDEPTFRMGIQQAASEGLISAEEAQTYNQMQWGPELQGQLKQLARQSLSVADQLAATDREKAATVLAEKNATDLRQKRNADAVDELYKTAQQAETARHNAALEAQATANANRPPNPTGDAAKFAYRETLPPEKRAEFDAWDEKQKAPPNPTSASLAVAAAGGDKKAQAALNLMRPPSASANSEPEPLGPGDAAAREILGQTGLSLNAFRSLIGQTSQLPRDKDTRNMASKEAQEFARERGVDISTIASQYATYNKVLAFNMTRQNMATVQEQEIQGTIENLKSVANDASLKRLNWGNVVKIWAGQQVNDPTAQQYAFHLEQLRNEIVAYNQIAQGQINADGSLKQSTEGDLKRAETVIKNGIDSGSLAGLENGVKNSTSKMAPILQRSVDAARRGVWDLFGVGKNFKGKAQDQPNQTSGGTPKISTKAEWDALPSGATYTNAKDGKQYRKP